MAEHNTLWTPRLDLFDRRLRFLLLELERQTHAEKNLAVRIVHAAELREGSPWLGDLVEFEIDDCVGEDERSGWFVKESELLKDTSGNKGLIDISTQFFRWVRVEVFCEVDVHMPRTSSLTRAG